MTKDMTSGKPLTLILRFALPMMIGAAFQQLYSVVDMLIIGNILGSRALAAVGATGSAIFFSTALVMGVTTGFTVVMSQYFGAKNLTLVKKTFVSVIYVSLVCAVFLALLGFFFSRPLMVLLQTTDEIIVDASLYLQITMTGSAGLVAYNALAAVLGAVGDSRTPLLFLIVTSLLNIALDLLLVLVLGFGVPGAAVATVISQLVSAAACAIFLFKKYEIFRLSKGDYLPHWPSAAYILKIGLPVGFQSLLLSIGDMTITGVANTLGTDVVAAYATGSRIMYFSTMFCMNLARAFSVFAGQNLGARQIDRIKKGFRDTWIIVAALCVIMTVLVFLFGDDLMRLFIATNDEHFKAISTIARSNLRITASFYLFLGLIWLYNHTLRSMGDVLVPFASGILELVLKVGLSILLGFWFGYTGLWFAMPLGWVLGLIPPAIRYHSGSWKKLADKFKPA